MVFEILSPGNTTKEMNRKFLFYQDHGVEEYYLYDPQKNRLTDGFVLDLGWMRLMKFLVGFLRAWELNLK